MNIFISAGLLTLTQPDVFILIYLDSRVALDLLCGWSSLWAISALSWSIANTSTHEAGMRIIRSSIEKQRECILAVCLQQRCKQFSDGVSFWMCHMCRLSSVVALEAHLRMLTISFLLFGRVSVVSRDAQHAPA